MSETFDPYHKWLGIPPEDQPPNHYRLLGINVFESDPDVIDTAADQRMSHVRSYQTGDRAELSQKILNEISAARVCLLDVGKKAAYDARLKAKQEKAKPDEKPSGMVPLAAESIPDAEPLEESSPSRIPRLSPPPIQKPVVVPSPSQVLAQPIVHPKQTSSVSHRSRHRKPAWQVPTVIGGVAAVAIIIAIVVIASIVTNDGDKDKSVAKSVRKPHETADPATVKPARPTDNGFVSLFDGKTLEGWRFSDPSGEFVWGVRNEELTFVSRPERPSLISLQVFEDFELELEFLLEPGANSGVYLRGLYEVQLHDDVSRPVAGNKSCGAIFGQIAPTKKAYLGPGRWNSLNVKLVGKTVTVTLNGQRIIDASRISGPTPVALTIKEGQPGPILLQSYDGEGRFRQIRIRAIKK